MSISVRNIFISILALLMPLLVIATGNTAQATDRSDKITICHATSAVANPYNQISVDQSAVDGDGANDHFGQHTGPVFDSSTQQGDEWGDIIPPIADVHSGLNWTAEGQAIYNNNCVVPTLEEPELEPTFVLTPGSCDLNAAGSTFALSITNPYKYDTTFDIVVNGELIDTITAPNGQTDAVYEASAGIYNVEIFTGGDSSESFEFSFDEDIFIEPVLVFAGTVTIDECKTLGETNTPAPQTPIAPGVVSPASASTTRELPTTLPSTGVNLDAAALLPLITGAMTYVFVRRLSPADQV